MTRIVGDHQPQRTSDLKEVFKEGVYELPEPKKTAKYTPPQLPWRCLSWLLWRLCEDCGARPENVGKKGFLGGIMSNNESWQGKLASFRNKNCS